MACTTTFNSKNIDIEELFLNDKSNKVNVIKNEENYINMLYEINEWVEKNSVIDGFNYKKEFARFYGKMVNRYRIYCKKNILVYYYRKLISNNLIENNAIVWTLIQKRPARNLSGVTVITVLTSPYPNGQKFSCKHNCYYCPNEPDQPRSYLKTEPAVARANRNNFDAILQMEDRLHSLMVNGHELDKLEIIIEGGTYTEYPKEYLEEFHRDLIYAANTYFDKIKREKYDVETEISINKTTRVRIIGICIETRPDALVDDNGISWLPLFRKWGVTRVQLGVQHTNDDILKKVNRGHTYAQACEAVKYLKNNCFKVDIHLMPDLPGSNAELDKEMFRKVFNEPDLQPDQVKIYPCEVVPWTVIQKWHQTGKYKPYAQTDERALLDAVKYAMEICPPWIRLPRVIRDIPLTYIEGGNMYPNLRQMLTDELEKEGKYTMDIRARECGRNTHYKISDAIYVTRKYVANDGIEYFISLESKDAMCIFGFTRLRIPISNKMTEFGCLVDCALIRELHVYGNLIPVGFQKNNDSQHKGVGKILIHIAEEIAMREGFDKIAVISGIGVTGYYEKLGYDMVETFMVKELSWITQYLDTIMLGLAIIVFTIVCYMHI